MMIVDFQIALAGNFQIEQRMFGEELEHVIEKRQAGADLRAAIAIQGQLDAHICLFRFAPNQCLTSSGSFLCFHSYLSLTADKIARRNSTTNLLESAQQQIILFRRTHTKTKVIAQHWIAANIANQDVSIEQLSENLLRIDRRLNDQKVCA